MPRTLLRTVFNVNENFGVTQDYHEISRSDSRKFHVRICWVAVIGGGGGGPWEGWLWWSVESWRTNNDPDEAQGKEEIGDAQSKDSY